MATAAKRPRHNRTITVDFHDEATYFQLLDDGPAFVEWVIAFVVALGFQLRHQATWHGGRCLTRHSHMFESASVGSLSGVSSANRVRTLWLIVSFGEPELDRPLSAGTCEGREETERYFPPSDRG
jgi:hypothetical protein